MLVNIMQELRKDRKIRMTIADKNIDEYIMLNLEELPPENERSPFLTQVLKDKEDQRNDMLIQVSQMQLHQIMLMLRTTFGHKATMIKGSAFQAKVDNLLKKINEEDMQKQMKLLGVKSKAFQRLFDIKKSKQEEADKANEKKTTFVDPLVTELNQNMQTLQQTLTKMNSATVEKMDEMFRRVQ